MLLLQEKSRARTKLGLFVIEGKREITLAKKGGYAIESLFFLPEIMPDHELINLKTYGTEVVSISKEVYQKIAYRDSTEGVVAIAAVKPHELSTLKLSKNPLLLIAESPEKPGNIGALLRTADAAGVDAVIIANPRGDLYNPNIVRSSVGGLFTNQIATATSSEIISFLKQNAIDFYCATLQAASNYNLQDYTKPTAIVIGTEATGLSEPWRAASTQNIIIPMQGEIDSMNLSVAAAILIFEAKRQRGF